MNPDLAELADPGLLRRLLLESCAVASGGRIGVAFASGTAVAAASLGDAREMRWPIGCLAKLLTATLARRAAARGRLAVDGEVAPVLGAELEPLHGVTMRHLLEHTCGLDDSLLAPPRYEEGFLDRRELLQRVAALERCAKPGAWYSYGHLGAWLVAALLERVYGRAFAALVRSELLEPLGIDAANGAKCGPLCAASGARLELTIEELARFGMHALATGASLAGEPITALPGWHPLERGVCLGWKYAGDGWFGHQSVWPRASAFLRVQPRRGLALAVGASDQAAALVALRMFGSCVPELFRSPPRAAPDHGAETAAGVYEQAARRIAILRTAGGLRAETWERDARGEPRGAPIRASLVGVGGVLFARPASEHLPYVELVTDENGDRWLWNGRCVLRRA